MSHLWVDFGFWIAGFGFVVTKPKPARYLPETLRDDCRRLPDLQAATLRGRAKSGIDNRFPFNSDEKTPRSVRAGRGNLPEGGAGRKGNGNRPQSKIPNPKSPHHPLLAALGDFVAVGEA